MNTTNITISGIANRRSRLVNNLFTVSCVLCLILSYSHVVFAQETEERVVEPRRDGPPPKTVIYVAEPGEGGDVMIIGDVDAGEKPVIQRVSGETPDVRFDVRREEDAPADRVMEERAPQKGEPAKESSASSSMDPEEIKKRMLERRKRVMEGKQEEVWPEKTQEADSEPEMQQQPSGERQRGGGQPGASSGNERQDYVSAIVNNNLFNPLGSGGEQPRTQYALTAVISDTTDETEPVKKAVIEERGGNRSYYVYEGETFSNDEIAVETIDEDVVTLDREGESLRLVLGEGTSGGPGGGGRSGGGGNRGGNAPGEAGGGGGGFDPNQLPENARRMLQERGINIEELRNNPELQNRLRGEFMQRFGGGGRPDMRNFRRPDGGGGNFGGRARRGR